MTVLFMTTFDGLWLSDGYALFLEVQGKKLTGYEITSVSCLPSISAQGTPIGDQGQVRFLAQNDQGEPDESLGFEMIPGSDQNTAWLQFDGVVSNVKLERVAKAPAVFETKTTNTPMANYQVFWQTWKEHYPFFDLQACDWATIDQQFRPLVTPATSDAQLFEIFTDMISPLNDAHTSITFPEGKTYFSGFRKLGRVIDDTGQLLPFVLEMAYRAREIVGEHYLKGDLRDDCNNQVHFGMLEGGLGYLRIDSFSSYAASGDFSVELENLNNALDEIFDNRRKLNGLVIDVRLNSGGSDLLGLAIVERLTGTPYLAYSKIARNQPDDEKVFTTPQPSMVNPSSRPSFHGPVVLLTSLFTVSAGENFAMALMDRTPKVSRVGENTQGVFSDVLSRKLPNGMRFGLPNEIFLTKDGKYFDVVGVPVEIEIPVFTDSDLEQGVDPALEKAIALLTAFIA